MDHQWPAAATSASLTSPDLDPAEDLDERHNKRVTASQPDSNDDAHPHPEFSCGSSRAPRAPSRHPKTTRPVTIRAGSARRVRHPTRLSKALPGRPLAGGSRKSQRHPASQALHAPGDAANSPSRLPRVELQGEQRRPGALAGETAGHKVVGSARHVPENDKPRRPYRGYEIKRYDNFCFPPPEMEEDIHEFERALEEARPPPPVFDMSRIEAHLRLYAEETAAFVDVMKEHHGQLQKIKSVITAQRDELAKLCSYRDKVLMDSRQQQPTLSKPARTVRLAKIAQAERRAITEIKTARCALSANIAHGADVIADALRLDFTTPDMIEEARFRKHQRNTSRHEFSKLVADAAMMGLRGTLEERDGPTRIAIERFARLSFDQMHGTAAKGSETPPLASPGPDIDGLTTAVPEWFAILDAQGSVDLCSTTPMARYKELMHLVGRISAASREEQAAPPASAKKKPFTKQYHDPGPGWPSEKQRTQGGWWTCRSGPGASPAELSCKRCHRPEREEEHAGGGPKDASASWTATETHEWLMAAIDDAMTQANERERERLRECMRKERAGGENGDGSRSSNSVGEQTPVGSSGELLLLADGLSSDGGRHGPYQHHHRSTSSESSGQDKGKRKMVKWEF